MENLKDIMVKKMQDVFSDVKWTFSLVEEGKDVPAYRKLQGIKAKLLVLSELIRTQMPDDIMVASEVRNDDNVAEAANTTV